MNSGNTTSRDNHELLITLAGKVDSLALSLNSHSVEFDKMWKHIEARDEKMSGAINTLAERQANFGKPNFPAIAAVCAIIGSIAVAFIAPLKADIDREHKSGEALASAVLIRDERISAIKSVQDEVKTKVAINTSLLSDISERGSPVMRERMASIENDLRWMRGKKSIKK